MSFEQLLLAGKSQTLKFKYGFDKTTVESLVALAQVKVEQLVGSNGAGQVTAEVVRLLSVVHDEMSRQQLQDALALKSRDNFDNRYLKAAIELKLIEPTIPDKPNSHLQKYRLTQAGQAQLLGKGLLG